MALVDCATAGWTYVMPIGGGGAARKNQQAKVPT
jgi:hypothetical protein